jgi:hypothetical protein
LGARKFSLFDTARARSMRLISLLLLFLVFSCARPSVPAVVKQAASKEIKVQIQYRDLKVLKTQEFLGDELVLVRALGIIEKNQIKPISVASTYLGRVKKGQVIQLDTLKPLSVRLLPGQRLSLQISLFETENYEPAKKIVHRFNELSGLLAFPLAFTGPENPVAWMVWGVKASSFGLEWMSQLDGKDLLGVSETQWDYQTIQSVVRLSLIHI